MCICLLNLRLNIFGMLLRSGRVRGAFKRGVFTGRRARMRGAGMRVSGLRAARRGFQPRGLFRGRFVQQSVPELKFFNSDQDDASIAAGGTVIGSVNLIAQGVGESQRVGRKCVIRQVHARWNIRNAGTSDTATADETVRLMFVLDKQANGANASVTDMVETSNYLSFNNLANKGRFRTLMDRTYTLNSMGGAGNGTANDTLSVAIDDSLYKNVNIPIEFDGVNGTIGEIKSNNILVVTFSRVGAIALMDLRMRLRFSDN